MCSYHGAPRWVSAALFVGGMSAFGELQGHGADSPAAVLDGAAGGRRCHHRLDRWRTRFEGKPAVAFGVMFLSATVGIPPFYVVALVAGVLRIGFGRFALAGVSGRFCHFAALAFLPALAGA